MGGRSRRLSQKPTNRAGSNSDRAGAPLADDVLKCQLKPIDAKDYDVSLTAEEMTRLRAIFPVGVCDYSKPGLGQVPLAGTYQRLPLGSATRGTVNPQ